MSDSQKTENGSQQPSNDDREPTAEQLRAAIERVVRAHVHLFQMLADR